MKDVFQELEAMVNCKTCRWDQFCVKPPVMNRDEIESTLKKMEEDARANLGREEAGFGMLMMAMTFLGKDANCPTCLIFARRMGETPTLAQKIKELMQGQEVLPQCRDCGWEKFCLHPPAMTEEEKKAQVEKFGKQDDPEKDLNLMGTLIGVMLYDGKDTDCPACSIFVRKLRESPRLSQQIKEMMQNWGS